MRIKYINPQGLPEHYFRAVKLINSRYSKGKADYSVTELCAPPRIRTLKKRDVEIELDVGDSSHSLAGTAMHHILEVLREDPDYVIEKRMFREIDGAMISGQMDGYFRPQRKLFDWKGTKWNTYSDGVKFEYVAQLNICKWLVDGGVDENGEVMNEEITCLESTALFRDYSKMLSMVSDPKVPVGSFNVPVWETSFLEDFILTRIRLMRQAELELPTCTDTEVWAKKAKWAVEPIKASPTGLRRARKLAYTQEEAEQFKANHKQPNTLMVVFRPGTRPRCQHYCDVQSICDVWQNHTANPKNQKQKTA